MGKPTNHQNTFRMVAKTFAELEDVLLSEVRDCGGIAPRKVKRGVEFRGDKEVLYRANYTCRSALRIIKPIAVFDAPDEEVLYQEVKKIPWQEYLDNRSTFSIDGTTSYSRITHSKYLALKTKDAIVDKFREDTGKRPSVDKYNPDLRINVRLFRDACTISLDSSGESLHKRGYRVATGPAPLNEVLAAGMLMLTGFQGDAPFIDPMCGSGTLPIEAVLIAKKIPAGYFRESFLFQRWKDFDPDLWNQVKQEADDKIIPLKQAVFASDRSGRILQVARENIEKAGLTNDIQVRAAFVEDVEPPPGKGLMVTNPPYGERIKAEDIQLLYSSIGDNLKQRFTGYTAWILSAHEEALKHVGLRASRKIELNNGPLLCKYLRFELYEGSKKYGNEDPVKAKLNKKPEKMSSKRKRINRT